MKKIKETKIQIIDASVEFGVCYIISNEPAFRRVSASSAVRMGLVMPEDLDN